MSKPGRGPRISVGSPGCSGGAFMAVYLVDDCPPHLANLIHLLLGNARLRNKDRC